MALLQIKMTEKHGCSLELQWSTQMQNQQLVLLVASGLLSLVFHLPLLHSAWLWLDFKLHQRLSPGLVSAVGKGSGLLFSSENIVMVCFEDKNFLLNLNSILTSDPKEILWEPAHLPCFCCPLVQIFLTFCIDFSLIWEEQAVLFLASICLICKKSYLVALFYSIIRTFHCLSLCHSFVSYSTTSSIRSLLNRIICILTCIMCKYVASVGSTAGLQCASSDFSTRIASWRVCSGEHLQTRLLVFVPRAWFSDPKRSLGFPKAHGMLASALPALCLSAEHWTELPLQAKKSTNKTTPSHTSTLNESAADLI